MLSNHVILCYPLLLLPSIFPSIRVFSNELQWKLHWKASHQWLNYWNFNLSIILPTNIQGYFPLGLTGLTSLLSKRSQESSPTWQLKSINSSALSLLYGPVLTSIHDSGKTCRFDYTDLYWQSDVFVFNMLSRFAIAFLPGSKSLLISWLQSSLSVILEPKKIKPVTASTFSPSIWHEWWDLMPWS